MVFLTAAISTSLWATGTTGAVGATTYFGVKFRRRVRAWLHYRQLNLRVGHFTSKGKLFYREDADGPLYQAVLKRSKGINPRGELIDPEYDYTELSTSLMSFNESSLVGATPVRRLPRALAPSHLVVLFSDDQVSGVGFRMGENLITARHVLDLTHNLWVQGPRGRIRVEEPPVTPPVSDYEYTGADICYIPLTPGQWADLGVKSMKKNAVSLSAAGLIKLYGADDDGLYESIGPLKVDPSLTKGKGLISYVASTTPGFSGSPIIMRNAGGGESVVGMHVCGDFKGNGVNHGVGASSINLLLKGTGAVPDALTVSDFLGPSKLESAMYYDKQETYWDWVFEREDDRAYEEAEREAEEAEVEELRDLYYGETKLALAPVAPPKPSFNGPGARALRSYNESALNVSSKGGPVESSTHLARFLMGASTERFWSRSINDTPPAPLLRVGPTVKATPELVVSMFTKIAEGNHEPFLLAIDMEYDDLLNCTKDEVMDPFSDFRQYLEHTRKLMKTSDGGRELPDQSGRTFFRETHRTTQSGGGKKRTAPVWLNDETKAFLRGLGVEGEYCRPPNDEASIIRSMENQAARQLGSRAWPSTGAMEPFLVQYLGDAAVSPPTFCPGKDGFDQLYRSFDDSSAGWTRRYRNLTKKSYVSGPHRGELTRIAVARILLRCTMWHRIPSMTPEEMVWLGLRDPTDVFVKDEPHTADKARREMWRLIWNVSLVDSICQAYFNRELNLQQNRDYQGGHPVPHTCGMGHHDDGIKRLGEAIEAAFPDGVVCSSDASGWDMSVSRDGLIFDGLVRAIRTQDPSATAYHNIGTSVCILLDKFVQSAHMICTGTSLWSVDVYGITASGLPDTTTQNSFVRGMGAKLAGCFKALTAGDDLLCDNRLRLPVLTEHGTITKGDVTTANWRKGQPVGFTSHSLVRGPDGQWSAHFENESKALHRLLLSGKTPLPEQIGGVAFAERKDEAQLGRLRAVCDSRGWPVPPQSEWAEDFDLC